MTRKDSNRVGILSDQGEARTASNLSEYTIQRATLPRLVALYRSLTMIVTLFLFLVRGLPRVTENNPDDSEILLDLSTALCQHFPVISKDFAIVYYVTIAPYNSKSSSRYYVCLGALVLAYFQRAPGLLQVHSYYHQLSHSFVVGIFAWVSADNEESD